MGSEGALNRAGKLDIRLLGDAGWEEVAIYDGDQLVWKRDEHQRLGPSPRRVRVRVGGARIKDRYRGAWWNGKLRVIGTPIQDVMSFGFDHPEQRFWRESADTIAFQTVTNGDNDSIELTLGNVAEALFNLEVSIHGYVKVGDPLQPPAHGDLPMIQLAAEGPNLLAGEAVRHEGGGTELIAAIEPITEKPLLRDLALAVPIDELFLGAQSRASVVRYRSSARSIARMDRGVIPQIATRVIVPTCDRNVLRAKRSVVHPAVPV